MPLDPPTTHADYARQLSDPDLATALEGVAARALRREAQANGYRDPAQRAELQAEAARRLRLLGMLRSTMLADEMGRQDAQRRRRSGAAR